MPFYPSSTLRSIRSVKPPAKSHLELKLVTMHPYYGFSGISNSYPMTIGVITIYPAMTVYDRITIKIVWYKGDSGFSVVSYGEFAPHISDSTVSASPATYGIFIEGGVVVAALSGADPGSLGSFSLGPSGKYWVKWSNIGSLDFTIWKDNIAGERPLDWKGLIYSVKKLNSKVIAYGENGVSILIPAGNTYGLQTVYTIGIKGRQAVAGDDNIHYFIDTLGQLWSFGDSLEMLDYSEYLNDFTNPTLSWDVKNGLLYICDGTTGYIYCPKTNSLGAGPVNVTSIASQDGRYYSAAPAAIVTPPFEICTNIYDMGTHKHKTIFEIEFGTNVTGTLQAAIDYRTSFKASFTTTAWKTVPVKGAVLITALGREFRIRAKVLAWEYLELDYIIMKGLVHNF